MMSTMIDHELNVNIIRIILGYLCHYTSLHIYNNVHLQALL